MALGNQIGRGHEESSRLLKGRRNAPEMGQIVKEYFSLEKDDFAEGLGKKGARVERGTIHSLLERYNSDLSKQAVGLSAYLKELEARAPESYASIRVMQIIPLAISLLLFAVAIAVDFQIANEFWTQTFLDEFGQEGIVSSGLKAMQVVFAVLAMHIVLRYGGRFARRLLAWILLFILVPVVVGFGLLVSLESLPPGAEIFGIPVSERVATLAEELGGAAAGESNAEVAVKSWETILRLGSLSLVFLLVTGVGAFALTYALNSARAMMGTLQADEESKGAERLPYLRFERLLVKEMLDYMTDVRGRTQLLRNYASHFLLWYRNGLSHSGLFGGIGKSAQAGGDGVPQSGELTEADANLIDDLDKSIQELFEGNGPFSRSGLEATLREIRPADDGAGDVGSIEQDNKFSDSSGNVTPIASAGGKG